MRGYPPRSFYEYLEIIGFETESAQYSKALLGKIKDIMKQYLNGRV